MMTPPKAAIKRLRPLYLRRFDLEQTIAQVVAEARAEGATWSQIAEALGVSKQAAQQRYGNTP